MNEKISNKIKVIKTNLKEVYTKTKTTLKEKSNILGNNLKNIKNLVVDKISKIKDEKLVKNQKLTKDKKIKNNKNSKDKNNKSKNLQNNQKNSKLQENKNNNKTKSQKLNYKSLTINQIETELNRTKYNQKYMKILRSTIYSLIIIASIATIIATLIMPVLEVSTSSMANTYNEGDIVVSIKTKNIESGDIIAFYHGNKILVKRVIATSGSWVVIDEDGNVSVNGKVIEEPYLENKTIGEYNIEFPYQVPDGEYFVLSDNRQESIDSRNKEVGCVSQEDVIGKILFRIWPLNK